MTNRTSGQLIAHLSFRLGGSAFCKSRFACATVTPDNTMGYQICKRCAGRLTKMKEAKAKKEAKASAAVVDPTDPTFVKDQAHRERIERGPLTDDGYG